jgi:hypothetical protein
VGFFFSISQLGEVGLKNSELSIELKGVDEIRTVPAMHEDEPI